MPIDLNDAAPQPAEEPDVLEEQAALMRERERMNLPAVYVDRFYLTYWANHIRITFGETGVKTGGHWRFAAVIEASDVKRLIKRLTDTLEKVEAMSEDSE